MLNLDLLLRRVKIVWTIHDMNFMFELKYFSHPILNHENAKNYNTWYVGRMSRMLPMMRLIFILFTFRCWTGSMCAVIFIGGYFRIKYNLSFGSG